MSCDVIHIICRPAELTLVSYRPEGCSRPRRPFARYKDPSKLRGEFAGLAKLGKFETDRVAAGQEAAS